MKQKHLESLLQQVDPFTDPKIDLEQYQTSSHLAACILMSEADSFEGKLVADLGCGSGMLTAGLLFLGVDHVMGIDIDPDALTVCRGNLIRCFEDRDEDDEDDGITSASYDLVQADVRMLDQVLSQGSGRGGVDCVIMNPPFGTRHPGIDISFLQSALSLAPNAVYSLHKSSTRRGISRRCEQMNVDMEVLAELRFDLPATYQFHRQKSADVLVDFIRFSLK